MPREELQALVTRNLAYQIQRQSAGDPFAQAQAPLLADKLASVAFHPRLGDTSPAETVRDVLAVAEFLARESRALKDR